MHLLPIQIAPFKSLEAWIKISGYLSHNHFVFPRVLIKLRVYECGRFNRKRRNALTNAFNLVRIDSTTLGDSQSSSPRNPETPRCRSDYTTRYVERIRTCACKWMRPQSNATGAVRFDYTFSIPSFGFPFVNRRSRMSV